MTATSCLGRQRSCWGKALASDNYNEAHQRRAHRSEGFWRLMVMSGLLLIFLFLLPVNGAAQELPWDTAQASSGKLNQLTQTQRRCCNVKGAIIGGAIGAAIGAGYARLCDAGSCAGTYVKYMLIAGGIGATLGAFAERTHGFGVGRPDRRLRVAGVLLPGVGAGSVSVTF